MTVAPDAVASSPSSVRAADARLLPVAMLGWTVAWLVPTVGTTVAVVIAIVAGAGGVLMLASAWRARDSVASNQDATGDPGNPADPGGPSWRPVVASALLVCSALAAVAGLRAAAATASIVDDLAVERAAITATVRVTADPQLAPSEAGRAPLWLVRAVVTSVTGRGQTARAAAPVLVMATDEAWRGLLPSEVVEVTGRLGPSDRVGREVAVLVPATSPRVVSPPSLLQRIAGRLRGGLRGAVSGLPADPRGLVPGLVVGDDSGMPSDLEADFKTAGLTHLTAVSGTNVAITLIFMLGLARWLGARGVLLRLIGLLSVAGFVVLARPEPSVLRAAVMGVIAVAGAAHPHRRPLAALTVAVVALLLLDPWLARSYGFALSVLATAAIVVWVPPWRDALSRWLPRTLAEALAVPLAAQLACAPVIVVLSQQVSVVAVLANVLAAPAVAPATIAAIAVTAVAAVSEPVAAALAWAPGAPAAWISGVARWSAHVPHATVAWPGGVTGAVGLAIATVVSVVSIRRLARRPRLAIAVVTGLIVVFATIRWVGPSWPPTGWAFVACDVGQGDGLVLSAGAHTAVVVDTGPDPTLIDACLHRLGVSRVPLLVLTHSDADHIGGLAGVLRGRQVDQVAVAGRAWVPTKLPSLQAIVSAAPARLVELTAGTRVAIGSLTLDIVWPPADGVIPVGEGESLQNDACIAAIASWTSGLRVLLTGDLAPAGQRAVVASGADITADVLKVPHHGSRFQDPGFLAATHAHIAIVSVGADNRYGHPAPETLDALHQDGMAIERTDTDGSIAVAGGPGRVVVARSHGGPFGAQSNPQSATPPDLPARVFTRRRSHVRRA